MLPIPRIRNAKKSRMTAIENPKTEGIPQPLFSWSDSNKASFAASLMTKRFPRHLAFEEGPLADDQEEEEDAWEEADGAARSQEGGVCQTDPGKTASFLNVS
jgi:hypothetical protein